MTQLEYEGAYYQGARIMLLRLLDMYNISRKGRNGKDEQVYVNAELKTILSTKDNTRKFLSGMGGGYYNWQRDRKGRLKNCEFMFVASQKDEVELKRLQHAE